MLYTQTVAPETLELLKRLESEPFMDSFSLAGGTALALYLGHRVSVDLDLFTPESSMKSSWSFPYGTNMASKPNLQRNIL
ncbi:MAG: nucleotidyl transferase AbiEii/AbiGii toxin family protein [Alistipes onderdonkii]